MHQYIIGYQYTLDVYFNRCKRMHLKVDNICVNQVNGLLIDGGSGNRNFAHAMPGYNFPNPVFPDEMFAIIMDPSVCIVYVKCIL